MLSLVDDCDPQISSVLASIACPIVLLDREVNGFEADAVLTDQRSGVAQAIAHLHALGHRTVGIARHTDLVRPGRECGEAFRQAIAANGMTSAGEIVIEYDHVGRDAGREITDRLTRNGATAILAAVPLPVTAGIFERLDELGLHGAGRHLAGPVQRQRVRVGHAAAADGHRAGRSTRSRGSCAAS